nr:carboxypeptidase-like regulatory domain-containing protein [Spirosomataceae bacterium]
MLQFFTKKRASNRLTMSALLAFLVSFGTWAQEKRVSGTVLSADKNEALPGVSVVVKGTTIGTTTNGEGKFSINVPAKSTLVFSFVGFDARELVVGNQTNVEVTLLPSATVLNEVVVTALGISKQQRTLGYVTQKIDNTSISQARETNVVSQLAGKIAGVTVVNNPSGIGSAVR